MTPPLDVKRPSPEKYRQENQIEEETKEKIEEIGEGKEV